VPDAGTLSAGGKFDAVLRVVDTAIANGAFPAAVIEVGDETHPMWRRAFGRVSGHADAPSTTDETVFDLASLTKVLSTGALAMQDVERGSLGLDDLVGDHVEGWRGQDRDVVTIRDVLSHCSGLPAHLPFYKTLSGRTSFEEAICRTPLDYRPRERSLYSDLGFILLGMILGRRVALDARFEALRTQIGMSEDLQFLPPAIWKGRTAPTELDPWRGRQLLGEVHDENAAALGGVAGHAGLFGTAAGVGQVARHHLQILSGRGGVFQRTTVETFVTRRRDVPESSRALAWDTMLPTSSCGHRMSPRSFGHTGFTGTSLWIDPDRGVYVVFLTNRVCPSRENNAITAVRPALHDAVMDALD
jgi:CubicO group peptidase (beta-lactamase class C family)